METGFFTATVLVTGFFATSELVMTLEAASTDGWAFGFDTGTADWEEAVLF